MNTITTGKYYSASELVTAALVIASALAAAFVCLVHGDTETSLAVMTVFGMGIVAVALAGPEMSLKPPAGLRSTRKPQAIA